MRLGGVLDAAVLEVLVRHRLVDGVDWTETHRDGRELPVLRHQPRVRVRGDAVRRVRLLLAETVELVFAQAAFEERAGVRAGGGVTLDEDLVSAAGVVETLEEVVETHLVEGRRRRVGRDVTADADAGALCAVHRDGRVPADPRAVATLDLFVARELGLVLRSDRVDVVRGRDHRHAQVQLLRALEQAEHDLAATAMALRVDELVERLLPLARLLRIAVEGALGIRILVVHSHGGAFRQAGRSCH